MWVGWAGWAGMIIGFEYAYYSFGVGVVGSIHVGNGHIEFVINKKQDLGHEIPRKIPGFGNHINSSC